MACIFGDRKSAAVSSTGVETEIKYDGSFWSRKFVSNVDLSGSLRDGKIDTPLQCAFVAACMKVEPSDAGARLNSLATAEVTVRDDGSFLIEAMSEGRRSSIASQACTRCAAATFENNHPFNGCVEVVVEEIMEG